MKRLQTMTQQEVLQALRNLGMSISWEVMKAGVIQGVLPFGVCIRYPDKYGEEKEHLIIYRRQFEEWVDRHSVEVAG